MKKHIIALIALTAVICSALCSCQFWSVDFNGQVNIGTVFPTQDTTYSTGATVTIDGKTDYYADIIEAWSAANSVIDKAVTVKFYQDLVATGSLGPNGTPGISGTAGYLTICERGACDESNLDATAFVLDLNGHTIDAGNQTDTVVFRALGINAYMGDYWKGNVTVQNGILKGGYGKEGAGLRVAAKKSNVYLKNLIIEDNYSYQVSGGIEASGSYYTLTMIGCTVRNNKSIAADPTLVTGGGGMRICGNSIKLSLQDCAITGNVTSGLGGGIYAYKNTQIALSGTVVISGNTSKGESGEVANNLAIDIPVSPDDMYGTYFTSLEGLLPSSDVGITLFGGSVGYLTEKVKTQSGANVLRALKSDVSGYEVALKPETEWVEGDGCDDDGYERPTGYGWFIFQADD